MNDKLTELLKQFDSNVKESEVQEIGTNPYDYTDLEEGVYTFKINKVYGWEPKKGTYLIRRNEAGRWVDAEGRETNRPDRYYDEDVEFLNNRIEVEIVDDNPKFNGKITSIWIRTVKDDEYDTKLILDAFGLSSVIDLNEGAEKELVDVRFTAEVSKGQPRTRVIEREKQDPETGLVKIETKEVTTQRIYLNKYKQADKTTKVIKADFKKEKEEEFDFGELDIKF